MKANLISELINEYYHSLLKGRMPHAVDILDENYHNFSQYWNIGADDFSTMYDQAMSSKKSQRYYVDKGYFPKEAILAFIHDDHDFVKCIFRSLIDEAKPVDGRVSRFQIALDALLTSHNGGEQKLPLHYHEDRKVVVFYLSMLYPERYFYATLPQISTFLTKVKSNTPIHSLDIERVSKISKVLEVFMKKNEKLITWITDYHLKYSMNYDGLSFWKTDMLEFLLES